MKRSSLPARLVVGATICAIVAFAYGTQAASAEVFQSRVTAVPAIAQLVDMHQVDMRSVPSTLFQPLRHAPGFMPDLNGVSEQVEMARKRAAFYNPFAPANPRPLYDASDIVPDTPALSKAFNGMEDSASTCPYFGGCEPPDMAVASNGTFSCGVKIPRRSRSGKRGHHTVVATVPSTPNATTIFALIK